MFIFLMLFSAAHSYAADAAPQYNLDVSFDLSSSRISGDAKITLSDRRLLVFHIADLSISKVTLNGKIIGYDKKGDTISIRTSDAGLLEILYEGTFADRAKGNVISAEAISLTDIWYPQPLQLMTYRLHAALPPGFQAISEADRIESTAGEKAYFFTFYFAHPLDHLTFIASAHYKVLKDKSGDTDIYAYFFDEDMGLAKEYIGHAKIYFDLYRKMIGPYPYARFSIVENIFPTGYSMPTYTLLGRDVVRLPFIVRTSLGHEILHQWFGNSVYIDYEKGNWAEGLTTYLADYYYEDKRGGGAEYRKQILIDYQAYVNRDNVFPLREFKGRTDYSSKTIGYGKAAMLFHMLKMQLGEDTFYKAIRDFVQGNSFRNAAWADLLSSFESASYADLKSFFNEWLERTDLPQLQAGSASLTESAGHYKIEFELKQTNKPFTLIVPISIYTAAGKETFNFRVDKKINRISFDTGLKPVKMVIDEDCDLMRMLSPEEFPPVIARLIGDKNTVLLVPSSKKEIYKKVIDTFAAMGTTVTEPSAIDESALRNSSLIILGDDNPMLKRINRSYKKPSGGFNIEVLENPFDREKVVALIVAESAQEADAALPKIFHYGKYSKLAFRNGRNTVKETAPSEKGIIIRVISKDSQ